VAVRLEVSGDAQGFVDSVSGEWTIERGEFGGWYLERSGERAIETRIDESAMIELEGDITNAQIELFGSTNVINESLAAKCAGQCLSAVADCGGLLVLLGAGKGKHAFTKWGKQHLGFVGEPADHHADGVRVVGVGDSIETAAQWNHGVDRVDH